MVGRSDLGLQPMLLGIEMVQWELGLRTSAAPSLIFRSRVGGVMRENRAIEKNGLLDKEGLDRWRTIVQVPLGGTMSSLCLTRIARLFFGTLVLGLLTNCAQLHLTQHPKDMAGLTVFDPGRTNPLLWNPPPARRCG
jgi:hypothetical protein